MSPDSETSKCFSRTENKKKFLVKITIQGQCLTSSIVTRCWFYLNSPFESEGQSLSLPYFQRLGQISNRVLPVMVSLGDSGPFIYAATIRTGPRCRTGSHLDRIPYMRWHRESIREGMTFISSVSFPRVTYRQTLPIGYNVRISLKR